MDEDLASIERIRQGDDAGLAEIMTRHKEGVFRFACRFTGNEADAAELTEDVFFRVYTHADRFRPKAKVRTWIFSITANLCRDHLRRTKKFRLVHSLQDFGNQTGSRAAEDRIADKAKDPSQQALSREKLDEIEAAIQTLPHKLRFPFIFCVLEENSYQACAEVLETSRKIVENRIYQARQRLRSQLSTIS